MIKLATKSNLLTILSFALCVLTVSLLTPAQAYYSSYGVSGLSSSYGSAGVIRQPLWWTLWRRLWKHVWRTLWRQLRIIWRAVREQHVWWALWEHVWRPLWQQLRIIRRWVWAGWLRIIRWLSSLYGGLYGGIYGRHVWWALRRYVWRPLW